MTTKSEFRATVTEAFAATIADDSRRGSGPAEGFDTAALPDPGAVVGGLYRLVRLLGKGMFGRVYVAERVDVPEHQVALKVVPREVYSGRNVERELVMLAAAGHPNIVQLKDHGMTDGYVWLTMPVYEGETLGDRLKRGTLNLREAYEIFLPIARALEALHKAGLRHQDIKPENIFLARFAGRLHPILLDLGVAAEREARFVAGTILYASPEQVIALTNPDDRPPLTEKMDTYCLASTLLMALVGPRNFPGNDAESRADITQAHEERAERPLRDEALPLLEGAPREAIARAIGRWLDPDAERRPQISEVADELGVLLEQEREEARLEQRNRARARTVRRVTFGAMIAMLCIGGLVGYSKRETLRLANELRKARAEGAESFDKLDTCVASHQLTQRELGQCKEGRGKEQNEFRATLDHIIRTGSSSEAEHARQVQNLQNTYLGRVKACEDGAAAAARAAMAERDRLAAEWAKKEAQLTAERDELKKVNDQRAAELASMQGDREKCRNDLNACETYSEGIPTGSRRKEKAAPADEPREKPAPAPQATANAAAMPPSPPPQQTAAPGQQPAPQPAQPSESPYD